MSAQQHGYLATHIEGRGKICPVIGKSINNRMKTTRIYIKTHQKKKFP